MAILIESIREIKENRTSSIKKILLYPVEFETAGSSVKLSWYGVEALKGYPVGVSNTLFSLPKTNNSRFAAISLSY